LPRFCNQNHTKNGFYVAIYHVVSVQIFINVFAFLYVKANSKEICKKNILSFYFQENADVSIFVEIQG